MRQSAAEIDHAILDVAARIFAVHGFAHTSVQQIADAVGYSKPGLLHRFGSKEALHRAVLAEVEETVQDIVGHAVALQEDAGQVRQVLEKVVQRALDRPGMVQMMLRAFEPRDKDPGVESIQAAGYRLVDALVRTPADPAYRLRVSLALRLIASAATAQLTPADSGLHVEREQLAPLLVDLAAGVIGR
jgi:AcrR family transcriptional regulator